MHKQPRSIQSANFNQIWWVINILSKKKRRREQQDKRDQTHIVDTVADSSIHIRVIAIKTPNDEPNINFQYILFIFIATKNGSDKQ